MPAAVHEAIADAVGNVLSLAVHGYRVVVRSVIYRTEGDPANLLIVTMGEERDARYLTGGNVLREYEIVVSVIAAGNQQLETSIGDTKAVRQQARQTLIPDDTTARPFLPGVPAVYDVDAVDLPALPEEAHRANYSAARLGLIYRTSESTRGG